MQVIRWCGATLDPTERYRYTLHRVWDRRMPQAVWVMLNPSTADADRDDPTIRKCIVFTRAWGCGGMCVVNLYALRATDPKALLADPDPVGLDNDNHIQTALQGAGLVLAAWGSLHPRLRWRASAVTGRAGLALHHLGLNGDGTPRHPLYVPGATVPTPWTPAAVAAPWAVRLQA